MIEENRLLYKNGVEKPQSSEKPKEDLGKLVNSIEKNRDYCDKLRADIRKYNIEEHEFASPESLDQTTDTQLVLTEYQSINQRIDELSKLMSLETIPQEETGQLLIEIDTDLKRIKTEMESLSKKSKIAYDAYQNELKKSAKTEKPSITLKEKSPEETHKLAKQIDPAVELIVNKPLRKKGVNSEQAFLISEDSRLIFKERGGANTFRQKFPDISEYQLS